MSPIVFQLYPRKLVDLGPRFLRYGNTLMKHVHNNSPSKSPSNVQAFSQVSKDQSVQNGTDIYRHTFSHSLISSLALGSISVVGSIVLIWWFSRLHRKSLVWNLASWWHPYRFCRPYQMCTLILNPPPLVPQCQDHQLNGPAQDLCPQGIEKIPDFQIHSADSTLLSWGGLFKNSWYLPFWKTWNTDAGVNDFATHQSWTVCGLQLYCENNLSIRPKCRHDRFSPRI